MNISENLIKLTIPLKEFVEINIEEIDKLEKTIKKFQESWSQSWLGYHSCVYYQSFKQPPTNSHFSSEWGLHESLSDGTVGSWVEYNRDEVINLIKKQVNYSIIESLIDEYKKITDYIRDIKDEILSLSQIDDFEASDNFVNRILSEIENLKIYSSQDIIDGLRPSGQFMSRDYRAMEMGVRTPPHIQILSDSIAVKIAIETCKEFIKKIAKLSSHIKRVNLKKIKSVEIGTSVFLGHGRSPLWRELKDFIVNRLQLPYDEFNRVPVAGVTNIARLSEMMNSAAFAFLIMTAEDEQKDGKTNARMNVVHEVGLFQGRLGFDKAIVLLEEGCEEFSNIQGLGQIRFPKGNISACFEDIRQVIERAELI